ncbi:MAG: hypothetical protein AAF770_02985 [Bacteroidota bacterium]
MRISKKKKKQHKSNFHFEIDKITIQFPGTENNEEPVNNLIPFLTTAVIITSVIGTGITYLSTKKEPKNEKEIIQKKK